jgi:hypothetical protein
MSASSSMYGEDSDWVKRYVKAQYGDDPSGAAVFKNSSSPTSTSSTTRC